MKMRVRTMVKLAAGSGAMAGFCVLLAACDAGPSAVVQDGKGEAPQNQAPQPPKSKVPSQDMAEASMPVAEPPPPALTSEAVPAQMGRPLPLPDGPRAALTDTDYGDWPLWSKNRKYSADDNAHYQYEHHGAEIGARSYADFLAMVHGFVHNPPKDTQTLRRRNGDTLYYNAHDNVFAVMTKAGAPRTLFRPRDGVDYWEQQKQIEAAGGWRGGGD